MNKLKHTKKTDFQDTLNLDSKSQLAKLLATENITVQHNNVATASFDVANRVLTLPIFKIKNKNVYDMLVGHECGHALWTNCDDWSEIGKDDKLRMAVNILEDTRIDKMIQSKFPGIVEDYHKGFKVLNDSNFYGMQDHDINELSFLDKDHTLIMDINKEYELENGIGSKGLIIIPEHAHPQISFNLEFYLEKAGIIGSNQGNTTQNISQNIGSNNLLD